MADLSTTWNRHANDVVTNNIASLMGDFSPAAMGKVMAIAAKPIVAQSFEVNAINENEVEITYVGTDRRVIYSKWEETGGKWQITDLADRSA